MATYTLGSVALLVRSVGSTFGYDQLVTRTPLIGDGTATTNNEVVQTGALPNKSAQFACVETDGAVIETLRGYHASSQTVTYTDDFASRPVVVADLRVSLPWPGHWEYSLTLIEVGEESVVGDETGHFEDFTRTSVSPELDGGWDVLFADDEVTSRANGTVWRYNADAPTTPDNYSPSITYSRTGEGPFEEWTLLVKFKIGGLLTAGVPLAFQWGSYVFALGGAPNNTGSREVAIYQYPDAGSDFVLYVNAAGGAYEEAVIAGFAFGTDVYLLWEHSLTESRAKVWKVSDAEPGSWLVTRDSTGDPSMVDDTAIYLRADGWTAADVDWIDFPA